MPPKPISALANDYANVLSFLKDRGVVPPTPSQGWTAILREAHQAAYSLILWKFRLKKLPQHGKVFVEEIASDAIQFLPQIMMGYRKTSKLLIRGIIENTLRHIYFMDHPVEFARMNRDGKWYINVEDLLAYAKRHHFLEEAEKGFDGIARITGLYSELSVGIHGRAVKDLEMIKSLKAIGYDGDAAARDAKLMRRCAEAANFLLAAFHHEQMSKFQADDRKIILKTMTPRARQSWKPAI